MGLAEKYEDDGVGMAFADFRDFGGGVAVARSNLAQVFARHAVQAVEGFSVIARGNQQVVKGCPIVSPVKVEPDALAKFVLVDFAAPPFIEDVLVASEDRFDAEHDGAVAGQGALLEQRGGVALGRGQGVVVADKNYIGLSESGLNLFGVQQRVVIAKSLIKLAKIFTAAVRILGADFTLHSGQRVPFGGAAAVSEIRGRGHQLLVAGSWLLARSS